MFTKDPSSRATVKTLLKHKFIKSAGKTSVLVPMIKERQNKLRQRMKRRQTYQPTVEDPTGGRKFADGKSDDEIEWDFDTMKGTIPILNTEIKENIVPTPVTPNRSSAPLTPISSSERSQFSSANSTLKQQKPNATNISSNQQPSIHKQMYSPNQTRHYTNSRESSGTFRLSGDGINFQQSENGIGSRINRKP